MMHLWEDLTDFKRAPIYRSGKKSYSDIIYAFDIEVSSLFNINGTWQRFDDTITDYRDIEKVAVPYIWMFGIEDQVYYGRYLRDFADVLEHISNPLLTKFVYIHNASYEFQFLRTIFEERGWTVTDLVARENRSPIAWKIEELNIIFRCTLHLTGLKLEKAAERYTSIEKKTGDLDYNKERSPLTYLSKQELGYCEYDILCVYEIVKYFREKYKHLKRIPLTSTSEMRRAYQNTVPGYHYKMVKRNIPDVVRWKLLNASFQGGLTHPNIIHANQHLYVPVGSHDESSAYPYHMCLPVYPQGPFFEIDPRKVWMYPHNRWCVIYSVRFEDLQSVYYNHYIARSKCRYSTDCAWDNGRLIGGSWVEFPGITDIDMDIIMDAYKPKKVIIYRAFVSRKGYLPGYYIRFVLDLYSDKTTLKGIPDRADEYNSKKSLLNSCFGACCTSVIKSTIAYTNNDWEPIKKLTDEIIEEKLAEERAKNNPLFVYAHGVYITAASRRSLWENIVEPGMDEDVVYYDTDSIKYINPEEHQQQFVEHNKKVDANLLEMCNHFGFDYELTRPKDKKGKAHPLGWFENEGNEDGISYTEFCTLGAKRYAYRSVEDNQLHITVSGVNKGGAEVLQDDISNFRNGLKFGYKEAKKNIALYIDHMAPVTFTDIDGNNYRSDYRYGVVIYPTTYTLGADKYIEEIGVFEDVYKDYILTEVFDEEKTD